MLLFFSFNGKKQKEGYKYFLLTLLHTFWYTEGMHCTMVSLFFFSQYLLALTLGEGHVAALLL